MAEDAHRRDGRQEEPGGASDPLRDPDIDAAFAEIVAGWGPISPTGTTSTSDTTDATGRTGATGLGDAPETDAARTSPEPPATAPTRIPVWRASSGSISDLLDDGSDAVATEDSGDPAEDFHPGPTAPLPPWSDRLFWGALGGLVLGPVLLLVIAAARPGWGSWATATGLLLTIGGFACLVLRQPAHRSEDDTDQGARI